MESSNQFLGTERIGKLMQKYAIPCIISLLVGALYNIVDQIFIANASYLGSYGNAANTVVFPLTVVALAIAVMIGDGCCAFVSISLGQNEVPKARRSVGNAVVMCLVSSIVLTAVYLIFANTILAMFGGTVNAETYHHSQEYFFYITLGIPFYMFGQAMNPIIRADGSPRFAMVSTLAGAVLNIILDPIFIFGFRWGMMGAAVATVIGQVVTAALAVWYLLHMKIIRPAWADLRLKGSICGRTLTLGMTSFLSQISLVAAMAGHEPHYPCRRQPPVCHGVHPCGCGAEHYSGPHLYLRLPLGHDGRGGGYCDRSGGHRSAGGMVSAAHEDHSPGVG